VREKERERKTERDAINEEKIVIIIIELAEFLFTTIK